MAVDTTVPIHPEDPRESRVVVDAAELKQHQRDAALGRAMRERRYRVYRLDAYDVVAHLFHRAKCAVFQVEDFPVPEIYQIKSAEYRQEWDQWHLLIVSPDFAPQLAGNVIPYADQLSGGKKITYKRFDEEPKTRDPGRGPGW